MDIFKNIEEYKKNAERDDNKDYKKLLNSNYRNCYTKIYNIMTTVQLNYESNVIKKDKYSILMEKLDNLVFNYNKIEINNLSIEKKYETMAKIYKLEDKIKDISFECGSTNCSLLFQLHLGDDYKREISEEYKNLLEFYDNFFIPCSCVLEEDTSLVSITSAINLMPFAKKSNKSNASFIEKIQGADIYFPYNKKYMIVSGYFKKDPLNITRIGGTFSEKIKKIKENAKYLSIEDNFNERYLNQMSVRDFVVYDHNDIIDLIINANKDLIKYRTKPLSTLVKEFITSNLEKQRYILTIFLLSDSEDQFLAHIIYDMICNTSELLKPQPMAEEIYKSLHYSIQKLFRIAFKNVESKITQLQSLTEDDIPYDKRIAMMKVNDSIKSKALDKLKEVKGTRESSAKAQQYLDGLLKIPFGSYKKEPIISFLNHFESKIKKITSESINELEEFEPPSPLQTKAKDILLTEINKHKDNLNTESSINLFLNNITNSLEEIKKLSDDSNNSNDKEVLDKNEKLLDKMNKVKKIGEIIESGNYDNIEMNYENEETDEEDTALIKIENYFVDLAKEWVQYKKDKKKYLETIRGNLNKCVYGHEESKQQIERIIAQWMNGKMEGTVFGFQGPPGTGKTSIAKKGLAGCLLDEDGNPRPFGFLPLGGSSNGAILEGHSYTYLGSTWGRIIEILMETKCMNPIIYIDEVDKVSRTENGREIIGILTHLTDASQNHEFTDKYFSGIKFDLSKVLFVFSYNDPSVIDRILRDRITEINIKSLTLNEKVNIVKDYSLPEILETVGYNKGDIYLETDEIKYIVQNYTNEAGVRKLREKLFEIVREINLKKITDDNIEFPFKITEEYIKEIFSNKPKVQLKKIAKEPQIGFVNGLYATVTGTGGLTIVECVKTPSDRKLSLELTGQQGDVMKESMICAKTLAWNILPKEIKKEINEEMETLGNFGLHLHCPEASTPKDGPSAGITITTAIISRLSNVKVRNDIAMTGEIDLHGNVHAIGGLDAKLEGAKRAGVNTVLCPKDNEEDYKKIVEKLEKEKDDGLKNLPKVIIVSHIMDVLKHALVKHEIKFININKN